MQNREKKELHRFSKNIFELFASLLTALIVIILVCTFVFRQVVVNGPSMEPTLYNGERLIMSVSYDTVPSNNDIVVISHANDYDTQIIKRVIATEGQTLSINFDTNEVIVDGVIIDEPYINGETLETDPEMEIPSVIPKGYVFVMGDNRMVSLDSRSTKIGLIPVSSIIGKVQMRLFPFDKFGFI